jgi:hypothetical protein
VTAIILSVLSVPVFVGLYIYQRTPGGLLAHYKYKGSRLSGLLSRLDDYAGALAGAPMVFSIFAGACVLGFRLLDWLKTASWRTITFQSFFEWPSGTQEISTGFLGLDKMISGLVTSPPELWFIIIFPAIWAAALTLPTKILKWFAADLAGKQPD